jgi:hypothetical protein
LDRRALVFTAGLPLGLAIGSAVWLLVVRSPGADTFAVESARLAGIGPHRVVRSSPQDSSITQALAAPMFAVMSGPGAIADIAVKLEGLVRTPGRVAALLSINGGASDWLELGQTREGVTLQEVSSSKVVVDTATGLKDVALGETPASAEPATGGLPPGFRSPPPPASAPGVSK